MNVQTKLRIKNLLPSTSMTSKKWFSKIGLAAVVLFFSTAVFAQSPTVFFTDLTSGPNTGGENGNGTILTIYGNNFGTTQGSSTVTIGGQPVAAYKVWGGKSPNGKLETISVAIGSKAATGTVVVNTSAGASTCGDTYGNCKFTVRPGNIYCVSTSGNDSSSGAFGACWKSITHARDAMNAGDITYVQDGVSQTALDNYSASLAINRGSGTATNPLALVAYPGASVLVGSSSLAYGIRTPMVSGSMSYWVIAGLKLTSGSAAMDLAYVDGWRVVGNDFTCPKGSGQAACFHTDTSNYVQFFGNYVHNIGDQAGSIDKYYHGVYFTTNTNHVWAAWNEIAPNPTGSTTSGGCRAMQFYSTGGSDQYDLHVHDNLIHDAICDGINFSTVVPDKGTVEAYNNIVYHVGTGPDPANGSSNYSCVVMGGGGSTAPGLVYNNTLYDCGKRGGSDSGAIYPAIKTQLRNNIIYQLSGENYVNPSAGTSNVSGSNNVWYGLGNGPSVTSANVNANPSLVSPTSDFHLQSSSPAINAGVTISGLGYDYDGNVRPQGGAYDIGAYEYGSGTTVQRPNAPTGVTAVAK